MAKVFTALLGFVLIASAAHLQQQSITRSLAPAAAIDESAPVDMVYIWSGNVSFAQSKEILKLCPEDKGGIARFRELGTMRASMELMCQNLPWLNKVHVVLPRGSVPDWLQLDKLAPNDCNRKVNLVYVEDLVPADVQPMHSSSGIESYMRKIPGLSELIIYNQDDELFLRSIDRSELFTPDGKPRFITTQKAVDSVQLFANSHYPDLPHDPWHDGHFYFDHLPTTLRKSWLDGLETDFPEQMDMLRHAKCRSDAFVGVVFPCSLPCLLDYHAMHVDGAGPISPLKISPLGWSSKFYARLLEGPKENRLPQYALYFSDLRQQGPDVVVLNDNYFLEDEVQFRAEVSVLKEYMDEFAPSESYFQAE